MALTKIHVDAAKKMTAPLGKKVWRTAEKAAEFFVHEPAELTVRFFPPQKLIPHLIELYGDYLALEEMSCFDEEQQKWTDGDLIPLAAVAGPDNEAEDMEEFLAEAVGFLFWDGAQNSLIVTTSDEWDRERRLDGLDALGLHS